MSVPPPLDLQQIRVFLVLAEELHFGRTAERTGLTTSRVSQTIRKLEGGVGGRLFDRTSRRVDLTPLGEQFRDDMAKAYEQFHAAYGAAREAVAGIAGTLRIGMNTPVNGGPHLVEIIRAFEEEHPSCSVEMVDLGLGREQLTWLRGREVDLVAARLPLTHSDIVIGPTLSREPRILAVARRHPLAARDSIVWEDVGDYPVTDSPSLAREMIDGLAPPVTASGRRLRRVAVESFTDLITRVANGELVHSTVGSFVDYFSHPAVVAVPICDLPPSETALAWLTGARSAKLQAFVRTTQSVLAAHDLDSS